VQFPAAIADQLQDIDLSDSPLLATAMRILQEVLVVGRTGVLVDRGISGERPYWVRYAAEQIINWKTQQVNGDSVLSRVVLRESADLPVQGDPYAARTVEQLRVLELIEGVYTVTIFRRPEIGNGNGVSPWVAAEEMIPTRRGDPLTFIPFSFFGPSSIRPDVERPPLLDLVDVNLSHYRSSADLEHGRHYCGLPTPWASGVKTDSGIKLGPSTVWILNDPQARAGILEFQGTGLGAIEKALTEKERMMAVLGGRLLESRVAGVEAADTVRMRHSGEHAVLKTTALAVGLGLTKLLRWHAWWEGHEPTTEQPIGLTFNQDFFETRLSADEVRTLVLALQAGACSFETFYYNLQRGDWARPGVDVNAERAAVASGQD
jgi:hypothetical protein